jgi:CheY-like chemotaxis protein
MSFPTDHQNAGLPDAKAVVFSSELPGPVLTALEHALREGGCDPVEQVACVDEVVTFNCEEPGCPRQVDPRLTGTSLVLLDQSVSGVSGFEVLGVLRGLPETQSVKVVMLGPHGPHDHRSVLAAWGLNVDCYLTRANFLELEQASIDKLARYTRTLLEARSGSATP